MIRDFDLVAAPWDEEPSAPSVLIEAMREKVGGFIRDESEYGHNPNSKPHGRLAWSIYLTKWNLPYLDVSVLPTLRPDMNEMLVSARAHSKWLLDQATEEKEILRAANAKLEQELKDAREECEIANDMLGRESSLHLQAQFKLTAAESRLAALERDGERTLNIARGCLDYGGGYRGDPILMGAFHHGIQTVINALEAAAKRDPKDTQVNALERIGHTQQADAATGKTEGGK